jgi:hypothetical protein
MEPFILPVPYKGNTLQLEARLVIQGYTHKFFIIINGNEYLFEQDDSRDYRVILHMQHNSKEVDNNLLQGIIGALHGLQQP